VVKKKRLTLAPRKATDHQTLPKITALIQAVTASHACKAGLAIAQKAPWAAPHPYEYLIPASVIRSTDPPALKLLPPCYSRLRSASTGH
jgi:hypothetical protein